MGQFDPVRYLCLEHIVCPLRVKYQMRKGANADVIQVRLFAAPRISVFFLVFFFCCIDCDFSIGDNPELLYEELAASDNDLEKTARTGGNDQHDRRARASLVYVIVLYILGLDRPVLIYINRSFHYKQINVQLYKNLCPSSNSICR